MCECFSERVWGQALSSQNKAASNIKRREEKKKESREKERGLKIKNQIIIIIIIITGGGFTLHCEKRGQRGREGRRSGGRAVGEAA